MISDETFIRLCEAFFGPSPTIQLAAPIVDSNADGFDFGIQYGNPWANNSGLGVELLWRVKRVLLDETPLIISDYTKHANQAYVTVEGKQQPGEHTLTVEFDSAIVDASRLVGVDADRLPVGQWPKARKSWTITQTVPLQVSTAPE